MQVIQAVDSRRQEWTGGEGGHKLEDDTHKAHNVGELRDQTWDSLQENMTIQWEKHWDAEEAEESSEGNPPQGFFPQEPPRL